MKNCKTCRRTACRNYGKEMGCCSNYIMLLEEEDKMIEKFTSNRTENTDIDSDIYQIDSASFRNKLKEYNNSRFEDLSLV